MTTDISETRVEANVYRFSDGSIVIDESLFASDDFRRSVSDEAQIEKVAWQLAMFFKRKLWTFGNCTFYAPRDVDSMAGPLIVQLTATRKCQLLRKPFGQHLFEYHFCIEDLLRKWPLLRQWETAEDAQSCSEDLTTGDKHISEMAYNNRTDGAVSDASLGTRRGFTS